MRPRLLSAGLVLLVVVAGLAALAAADGYVVSSPDATAVPERTVDVSGESHTIDELIIADPGENLTTDVSAPDEVYRLHVRNSDERIEASKRGSGSGTFSFDLDGYEPGSYAVAPNADGTYRDVLPVLVQGYAVDANAPGTVGPSEEAEVTVEVTATDQRVPGSPARVQVVVANDAETHTVEATQSESAYVATVDASELSTGDYTLYGVVQGENQAFGRQEMLGRSDGQSLSVREATPAESDGSDRNGDPAGPDEGAPTPPPTSTHVDPTPTTGPTVTDSTTGTSSQTPTDPAGPTPTDTEPVETTLLASTDGTPAGNDETGTASADAVITPGTNTTTTTTPGAGSPGFTAMGVFLAATVSLYLLGRR